jgi:hypothetical protein
MGKKRKIIRPAIIRTLGDLLNGDVAIIATKTGDIEIRKSFVIGDDIFVRVHDSGAKDFLKFPPTYPVKGVVTLMPATTRPDDKESDPLLSRM